MTRVGIVAIGRNEGDRLRQCLSSVLGQGHAVVYVDSGSIDGSVELARQLGAEVVCLDMALPFSAARARNAGFERLQAVDPGLESVQFVDGDCEMVAGWLGCAAQALQENPDVAVVAGRRRERYPERSPYNRLCDLEWDAPVGEALACGGDALVRVEAFRQIGGFDPGLIAGEEPEMCLRLRAAGWKILRIAAEMALHDAAMTRFQQWRRRTMRAGYAYAAGAAMHGRSPGRHWVRETVSIWLFGFVLPLAAVGLMHVTHGLSLLLFGAYVILAWRIWGHCRRRQLSPSETRLLVFFTLLAKFPQLAGQFQFLASRLLRKDQRLIEYKGPAQ